MKPTLRTSGGTQILVFLFVFRGADSAPLTSAQSGWDAQRRSARLNPDGDHRTCVEFPENPLNERRRFFPCLPVNLGNYFPHSRPVRLDVRLDDIPGLTTT